VPFFNWGPINPQKNTKPRNQVRIVVQHDLKARAITKRRIRIECENLISSKILLKIKGVQDFSLVPSNLRGFEGKYLFFSTAQRCEQPRTKNTTYQILSGSSTENTKLHRF